MRTCKKLTVMKFNNGDYDNNENDDGSKKEMSALLTDMVAKISCGAKASLHN